MKQQSGLLDRIENKELLEEVALEARVGKIAEMLGESEEQVVEALARGVGIGVKFEFEILPNSAELFPLKLIHKYKCLPILPAEDARIHVVSSWIPNERMTQWVYSITGKEVVWYLGLPSDITDAMIHSFGVGSGSLEASASEFEEIEEAVEENADAAIIRFVNEIIVRALDDHATDIHFEPQKTALQIRYRIDGDLIPVKLPENLVKFQSAIISRLKIMAKLNISEKRRPQDGRIRFVSGAKELDIRLSTLPAMYGESVSLRLLMQGSQPITLSEIGLTAAEEKRIEGAIQRPHGIILVTGPTGSGKSTTLGACIRKIRTPEKRIITVEDPVEYEIEGINQSQVNQEIGFNFASALRHILRQDPDILMIGEIRDRETADIAIRASMTGHLVLSSLHTNDAAGALTRLIDMGIEPFLIASTVEMILAQRLVRRLCTKCAKPAKIGKESLRESLRTLGIDAIEAEHAPLLKQAHGCDHCRNLGYRGRIGIFEILTMSEAIHKRIIQRASAKEIAEQAYHEGMKKIQWSGWEKVKQGITTLESILPFAQLETPE
ncbi:MAG: secretion system protein E [Verrucomicrobia bacterium GWF2_51_19]|nr:MAG: secretion system protein E [Verrucomicrobia bacterium GWF2_51_19]HCJ12004.1 secretion system protein E [Opitutae bacterium]